jgi:hypothetical protein
MGRDTAEGLAGFDLQSSRCVPTDDETPFKRNLHAGVAGDTLNQVDEITMKKKPEIPLLVALEKLEL